MENNNKFSYSYSASEAEEIKAIRKKYAPESQPQTVLEQIRELDKKAEKTGTVISLTLGILGTLIFGTGMSFIMVWGEILFVLGIIAGVIGIGIAIVAYPVYHIVTKREREKIAPIILKLTDNISNL